MVTHTLVFSFPETMSGPDRERFFSELADTIRGTGLAESFDHRPHLPLPSDTHAPVFVSSAMAEVRCADLAALKKLSVHPLLGEFVLRWHDRFPYQVVWINSDATSPLA
ncbi:hypothetical protein [Streptomyces sp. 6N223]|uniref:hypothetical protein n=1 Tax=Streptomyces sp. 6N223 TaxID=3457412 RepID=UPI003FD5E3B0